MCEVYNAYENKLVAIFSDRKRAEAWIGRRAHDWNYGLCREWSTDGWDYFDVGPRVFKIKHEEVSVCAQ